MSLLNLMNSYARGAGYVDPRETATAYQQILEGQARDVSASNDLKRDSLNNLLDPDVIEKGTKPDSSKRMSMTEFMNTGMAKPEMSPQERWKNTIDMMIKSGNPVLQKQGIASLDNYFNSQAQGGETSPNSYREWTLAGQPGTYEDWLIRMKQAGSMKLNMGDDTIKPSDADKFVDAQGNRVKIPAGTTYSQANANGWFYGYKQSAEEIKSEASLGLSSDLLDRLDTYDAAGGDLSGIYGFVEKMRGEGNPTSIALDLAMSSMGMNIDPVDAEAIADATALANEMTAALKGAAASDEESKRIERQLPVPGQPKAVFQANLRASRRNLEYLRNKKNTLKGYGNRQPSKTKQESSPTINPDDVQWE